MKPNIKQSLPQFIIAIIILAIGTQYSNISLFLFISIPGALLCTYLGLRTLNNFKPLFKHTKCTHLITQAKYKKEKLIGYQCTTCNYLVPINPQYQKRTLKSNQRTENRNLCDHCSHPVRNCICMPCTECNQPYIPISAHDIRCANCCNHQNIN